MKLNANRKLLLLVLMIGLVLGAYQVPLYAGDDELPEPLKYDFI